MADKISVARRSHNMRQIRSRDTKPELLVRRLLWRLGYRFRVHQKSIAGNPDIVFAGRRKVIFVNGCFWHAHPGCKRNTMPKSRTEYWSKKLEGNKARDKKNLDLLRSDGWETLVIWECQVKDLPVLEATLVNFLGDKIQKR